MVKFPITCEVCGVALKGPGYLTTHRASALHRRAGKIRTLLATPGTTYASVGALLGVSRERIRQIAGIFGITRIPRTLEIEYNNFYPFADELKRHGIEIEYAAYGHMVYRFWAKLNGHRCAFRKTTRRGRYVVLRPCKQPPGVEFYIYRLGPDQWYVIPASVATKETNVLIDNPRLMPRTRGDSRDWLVYINAWHLLNKTDSTPQALPQS